MFGFSSTKSKLKASVSVETSFNRPNKDVYVEISSCGRFVYMKALRELCVFDMYLSRQTSFPFEQDKISNEFFVHNNEYLLIADVQDYSRILTPEERSLRSGLDTIRHLRKFRLNFELNSLELLEEQEYPNDESTKCMAHWLYLTNSAGHYLIAKEYIVKNQVEYSIFSIHDKLSQPLQTLPREDLNICIFEISYLDSNDYLWSIYRRDEACQHFIFECTNTSTFERSEYKVCDKLTDKLRSNGESFAQLSVHQSVWYISLEFVCELTVLKLEPSTGRRQLLEISDYLAPTSFLSHRFNRLIERDENANILVVNVTKPLFGNSTNIQFKRFRMSCPEKLVDLTYFQALSKWPHLIRKDSNALSHVYRPHFQSQDCVSTSKSYWRWCLEWIQGYVGLFGVFC